MDHHRALVLCRAGQERLADFPRLNHYALGKHSDGKCQIKELLPRHVRIEPRGCADERGCGNENAFGFLRASVLVGLVMCGYPIKKVSTKPVTQKREHDKR